MTPADQKFLNLLLYLIYYDAAPRSIYGLFYGTIAPSFFIGKMLLKIDNVKALEKIASCYVPYLFFF